MSGIGLPKGMTRDEAYIQGMADGEALAKPVVLVVVNGGGVIEVQEAIVGEAHVVFFDWEEVNALIDSEDSISDFAERVAELKSLAPENPIVQTLIESWIETCEDAGYDPDQGEPLSVVTF